MKFKARLKSLLLIAGLFAFTVFIVKSKLPRCQLQPESVQLRALPAQPRQSLLFLEK